MERNIIFKILIMIIQNKREAIMNLGWGGQEFEVGGRSKHYHEGGRFLSTSPDYFFDPGGRVSK